MDRVEYLNMNFYNLNDSEVKELRNIVRNLINSEGELSKPEKELLIKDIIKEKCEYYGYPLVKIAFVKEMKDRKTVRRMVFCKR